MAFDAPLESTDASRCIVDAVAVEDGPAIMYGETDCRRCASVDRSGALASPGCRAPTAGLRGWRPPDASEYDDVDPDTPDVVLEDVCMPGWERRGLVGFFGACNADIGMLWSTNWKLATNCVCGVLFASCAVKRRMPYRCIDE